MPQPMLSSKVQGSLFNPQTCPWSGMRGVSNLARLRSHADPPPLHKGCLPSGIPIGMRLPACRDSGHTGTGRAPSLGHCCLPAGSKYELPKFVLADPTNLIKEVRVKFKQHMPAAQMYMSLDKQAPA